MAPNKAPSPAMEFLLDALKKDKSASYADLKARTKLKIYPIMYGRAQALLGIVKSAKRGTGKFARASAAKAGGATPAKRGRPLGGGASKSGQVRALLSSGMSAADIAKKVGCTVGLVYNIKSTSGMTGRAVVKRGPGRPRKVVAATGMDNIAGILDAVKSSEREKTQMRAALERIQGILADALS